MSGLNVLGSSLKYKNILVVIKQTAFEEYSQVRLSLVLFCNRFSVICGPLIVILTPNRR